MLGSPDKNECQRDGLRTVAAGHRRGRRASSFLCSALLCPEVGTLRMHTTSQTTLAKTSNIGLCIRVGDNGFYLHACVWKFKK